MKIFLCVFLLGIGTAFAAPKEADGRYRVVAFLYKCSINNRKLCIIINKDSRSEQRLSVAPTKWSSMLENLLGIHGPLVMTGPILKGEFTPEERPRLYAPSPDDVIQDVYRAKKL